MFLLIFNGRYIVFWKETQEQHQGHPSKVWHKSHLPTNGCSKSQGSVKPWIADSMSCRTEEKKHWTSLVYPVTCEKVATAWHEPINKQINKYIVFSHLAFWCWFLCPFGLLSATEGESYPLEETSPSYCRGGGCCCWSWRDCWDIWNTSWS